MSCMSKSHVYVGRDLWLDFHRKNVVLSFPLGNNFFPPWNSLRIYVFNLNFMRTHSPLRYFSSIAYCCFPCVLSFAPGSVNVIGTMCTLYVENHIVQRDLIPYFVEFVFPGVTEHLVLFVGIFCEFAIEFIPKFPLSVFQYTS